MKIQKITFSEVCRLMADREGAVKNCAAEIFRFALTLPDLICPELAAVIDQFSAFPIQEAVDARKSILNVLKKTENYYTSYENAQIAQVLIVFCAYFDTIARFLPDKDYKIHLTFGETVCLSEKAVADYVAQANSALKAPSSPRFRELLDFDLSLPNSFETKEAFDKRLLTFYQLLNQQFLRFYENLDTYNALTSAQLDVAHANIRYAPAMAVEAYHQQHYALATEYPDYFTYHTMDWQRKTAQAIDVGFQSVSAQIQNWVETGRESRAKDAMQLYGKRHERFLKQSILKSQSDSNIDSDGVTFPLNKDIFVPQSFKALRYRSGMALEPDTVWTDLEERQEIGTFISHTLRHWDTGSKPMVILGLPGAGKTLLCHMLAAQILRQEYHVIIIRLRDADAEAPIHEQITRQIHADLSSDCTWFDIVSGKLEKPIALIFDGYDELLQASGKTYADYISKIQRFQQEQQEDHNIIIRCIITSRTTLIDKSQIPQGAPILRLLDFDEERIRCWSKIWNDFNSFYFQQNGLEEFRIEKKSKVYELAKQPLLLMLLARFDANGNALRKHEKLTRAQLYRNLIRDFILREKQKDAAFCAKAEDTRHELIEQAFCRFGIVAMGMYNRCATFINSKQLRQDLAFFTGEDGTEQDGDKLFGSFFFIHTSKATEQEKKLYAYEFLHNTFGEFLAASFISHQLPEDIHSCPEAWYVCLSYAPLFSRPVVPEMFRELIEESGSHSKEAVIRSLDGLLTQAFEGIFSGKIITRLIQISDSREQHLRKDEPICHLAIYTANLLILRSVLGSYTISCSPEADIWDRLLNIWKYAFSQDDLARLAGMIQIQKAPGCYTVIHTELDEEELQTERLPLCYNTARNLQDSLITALAGTLDGSVLYSSKNKLSFLEAPHIINAANEHGLKIQSHYLWNCLIWSLKFNNQKESVAYFMEKLHTACITEDNQEYLYACYSMMLRLIQKEQIKTLSTKDSQRVAAMLLQLKQKLSFFSMAFMHDVIAELLDYLDLDDPTTLENTVTFLHEMLDEIRSHPAYPAIVHHLHQLFPRILRIYDYLAQKPELNFSEPLSHLAHILEESTETDTLTSSDHALYRGLLVFASHLIATGRYAKYGLQLLKAFEYRQLSSYGKIPAKADPDFTATVICYLNVLVENGFVPAVAMLAPAMEGISVGQLYRVYPDSLPQLINLMSYDPGWLTDGFEKLAQFVQEQGDGLSLASCRALRALAQKSENGAPLLAAIDRLLK